MVALSSSPLDHLCLLTVKSGFSSYLACHFSSNHGGDVIGVRYASVVATWRASRVVDRVEDRRFSILMTAN